VAALQHKHKPKSSPAASTFASAFSFYASSDRLAIPKIKTCAEADNAMHSGNSRMQERKCRNMLIMLHGLKLHFLL